MAGRLAPVFMLFVAVASNYLARALPCGTQRLLSTATGKLVALYVVLVFGVLYSSNDVSIGQALKQSALPYVMFLAFLVVDAPIMLLAIALVAAQLVLGRELDNRRVPERYVPLARDAQTACGAAAVALTATGMLFYLRKQLRDHGADFSWRKFFSLRCSRSGDAR